MDVGHVPFIVAKLWILNFWLIGCGLSSRWCPHCCHRTHTHALLLRKQSKFFSSISSMNDINIWHCFRAWRRDQLTAIASHAIHQCPVSGSISTKCDEKSIIEMNGRINSKMWNIQQRENGGSVRAVCSGQRDRRWRLICIISFKSRALACYDMGHWMEIMIFMIFVWIYV